MTYHSRDLESRPKSRRARVAQVVLFLFIIGIAGSAFVYRGKIWSRLTRIFPSTADDPIPTMALEKVAFQLEVPALGEITGLDSISVPTPNTRSGALRVAWLIPEGSLVKVGDTLVRFDSTEARLNLEKQQNTLQSNQEQTKITTGKQTTEEKVLSIDRSDAEKEYNYALTVMPQDETIFTKWEIIEAKINANLSKERIDFLTNKGRVQKRIARAEQQILNIEKSKAQAEIAISNQTLDSLELKAPKAGLVLYRRQWTNRDPQVGEESWPGQVLVELVDLHALQARVYVLEMDAGDLAKDRPVTVRLDSILEKEFHGKVRSVATLAQPLERNSPLKYFTCEVTIQDAYKDMRRIKPGMSLKAKIILEKYDSCFLIPAGAVTIKGVDTLVYVKQGDRFLARPVKIGAGTHGRSIVLGGVEEKEIIAMRNPFETRKAHLPDFSKASAPPGGGGMRITFR